MKHELIWRTFSKPGKIQPVGEMLVVALCSCNSLKEIYSIFIPCPSGISVEQYLVNYILIPVQAGMEFQRAWDRHLASVEKAPKDLYHRLLQLCSQWEPTIPVEEILEVAAIIEKEFPETTTKERRETLDKVRDHLMKTNRREVGYSSFTNSNNQEIIYE